MSIANKKKEECCGCSACEKVCPKDAIEMIADEQGFKYPQVNEEKCISCDLCELSCPQTKPTYNKCISAYAVKHKINDILEQSSSGGVARALAETVIRMGGVVYGVAYDSEYVVVTQRATDYESCNKFYGSKYVATDNLNSFSNIEQDLRASKKVLFFGTSCHVDGLYKYLGLKKCPIENLFTVDLICHGVPSPRLFADYIKFLKKNKDFRSYSFRTKNLPWGFGSKNYGPTIEYRNGKKETNTDRTNIFLKLFFSNNCLRPNCYDCKYCGIDKPSDITIADYWGIRETHPDFYSEKGVSAVITHSEKGEYILKECCDVDIIPSEIKFIEKYQGNLHQPSKRADSYNEFWELYNKNGFIAVARKYGGLTLLNKLKRTWLYKVYIRKKMKSL